MVSFFYKKWQNVIFILYICPVIREPKLMYAIDN
jgi:hypothetical protein